jgi:tRNA pseudouridine65 synthase
LYKYGDAQRRWTTARGAVTAKADGQGKATVKKLDDLAAEDPADALRIAYEDDDLVVVEKPSGLMTHPSDLDRRAPDALRIVRGRCGAWVTPVHRLDRGTSGLLVFARRPEAASRLGAAFAGTSERAAPRKTYVAIARGHLPDAGVVDKPLAQEDGKEPRPARTTFTTIARGEMPWSVGPYATARYSLVRLEPETGRRHQLRRHLRWLAHPIVGDRRYGDTRHNDQITARLGVDRLLLHAAALSLEHPTTGATLALAAAPPATFRRVATTLFGEATLHGIW